MKSTTDYNECWKDKWLDCSRYGPSLRFQQRIIRQLLSGIEFRSVLDVGCGNGVRLSQLVEGRDGIRVTGVDISEEAVKQAGLLFPEGAFRRLDIEKEALGERFDLVVCSEVLEHVADDDAAIARLLKMSGRYLLVSSPQGTMYEADRLVGHLRHYREGELKDKLRSAGFTIRKEVSWGFPFYSPLHRYLLNRFSDASEGRFGWKRKLLAGLIYRLFHLNSWKKGDMLVILAEKPLAAPRGQ
ncbi:MAG: class I SAM-dependent methyltransferase [Endomicrobiales bacterium]